MRRSRATRLRTLTRWDDDALVEAASAGDEAAFAELASRHRPWLVELCRRHLSGDAQRAEDVAQECLVKLHAVVRRDRRPLKTRSWLSVVARNACIDVHRSNRSTPTHDPPDAQVEDVDPFAIDPVLAQAWEELTDRQREVLHHRELLGLSYDEIALAMSTTTSAVETLLFRARAALRRNYQRAGGQLLGCGLFGVSFMRLLDEARTSELDNHLASCNDCTDAAHRLTQTTELLRLGEHATTTTDLAARAGSTGGRLAHMMSAISSLGSAPGNLLDAIHAAPAAAVATTGAVIAATGLAVGTAAVTNDTETPAAAATTAAVVTYPTPISTLPPTIDSVVDLVTEAPPFSSIPLPSWANSDASDDPETPRTDWRWTPPTTDSSPSEPESCWEPTPSEPDDQQPQWPDQATWDTTPPPDHDHESCDPSLNCSDSPRCEPPTTEPTPTSPSEP